MFKVKVAPVAAGLRSPSPSGRSRDGAGTGPYQAGCDLHHGIQPAFRGVQVPRDQLLPDLCLELVGVVRELQHMLEGKRGLALLLLVGARVPELLGVRVDKGEHCLVHKGPEA